MGKRGDKKTNAKEELETEVNGKVRENRQEMKRKERLEGRKRKGKSGTRRAGRRDGMRGRQGGHERAWTNGQCRLKIVEGKG